MIIVKRANVTDAETIVQVRSAVWQEVYQGIFPDEMLYGYDLNASQARFAERIADPRHMVYLFCREDVCIGYFTFGPGNFGPYKDFDLCLNNLYIRQEYTGLGLGRKAFEIIRDYCTEHGISKFYCGCNLHNPKAIGFYRHMGGIEGEVSGFHDNKADDIVHFEFYTEV